MQEVLILTELIEGRLDCRQLIFDKQAPIESIDYYILSERQEIIGRKGTQVDPAWTGKRMEFRQLAQRQAGGDKTKQDGLIKSISSKIKSASFIFDYYLR